MNRSRIRGDWGVHYADAALASRWLVECRRRIDAARRLVALGSPSSWEEQRTAIVGAWQAMAFVYQAANLSPPSDPLYRRTIFDWYGRCATTEAAMRLYEVGSLVALGGGRRQKMVHALTEIWRDAKRSDPPGDRDAPQFRNTAVRLSLSSRGVVVSTCLEATGEGDCSYRGLFTGCANTFSPPASGLAVAGQYREVSCDQRYSAETFEWFDGPGGPRFSPPLRLSLDVLSDLVSAWQERGDIFAAIDVARTFVLVSNVANAAKAGQLPEQFARESITLSVEADRMATGSNPGRSTTLAAIAVATAVCAAAAGVYAPVCALVGGVASLVAQIVPIAVGVAIDPLGMALLVPQQTAGFLPAQLDTPNALGAFELDVSEVPGASGADSGLRVSPAQEALASAARRTGPGAAFGSRLDEAFSRKEGPRVTHQRIESSARGVSPVVVLAVIVAAVAASGKGL